VNSLNENATAQSPSSLVSQSLIKWTRRKQSYPSPLQETPAEKALTTGTAGENKSTRQHSLHIQSISTNTGLTKTASMNHGFTLLHQSVIRC